MLVLSRSCISFITATQCRYLNANSAAITYVRRSKFIRLYPTKYIFHDGSTITARHVRPRFIVKIPLTEEDLHIEEEKRAFESRRIKIEKIDIKEDKLDVKFDGSQYLAMMKKKKKH